MYINKKNKHFKGIRISEMQTSTITTYGYSSFDASSVAAFSFSFSYYSFKTLH